MTARMISVIVPVYNAAATLPECVESLLAQTHRELEVLLVDDGSTDGSGALCDAYAERDSRIRVLHQLNGGPQSAVIHGVEQATGAFVGFVDSDDYVLPAMFKALLAAMEAQDVDCARCGFVWFGAGASQPAGPQEDAVLGAETIEKTLMQEFFERSAGFDGRWTGGRWDKLYRTSLLRRALAGCDAAVMMGEDVLMTLSYLPLCRRVVSVAGAQNYYVRRTPGSLTRLFERGCFAWHHRYTERLNALAGVQGRQGQALAGLEDRLNAQLVWNVFDSAVPFKAKYRDVLEISHQLGNKAAFNTAFPQHSAALRMVGRLLAGGYIRTGCALLALLRLAGKLRRGGES